LDRRRRSFVGSPVTTDLIKFAFAWCFICCKLLPWFGELKFLITWKSSCSVTGRCSLVVADRCSRSSSIVQILSSPSSPRDTRRCLSPSTFALWLVDCSGFDAIISTIDVVCAWTDADREYLLENTISICAGHDRRTYNSYADRCFAAAGPKLSNRLPAPLRQAMHFTESWTCLRFFFVSVFFL